MLLTENVGWPPEALSVLLRLLRRSQQPLPSSPPTIESGQQLHVFALESESPRIVEHQLINIYSNCH